LDFQTIYINCGTKAGAFFVPPENILDAHGQFVYLVKVISCEPLLDYYFLHDSMVSSSQKVVSYIKKVC
jgi:hypothetical protein